MLIPVLLADSHHLIREGLKRILLGVSDISVVAEADNAQATRQLAREHRPRVLVLDLSLPGMAGTDLIRRLKSEAPETAILVLTLQTEEQYALRAFRAGANGYLTTDSAAEELILAVRKLATNGAYLPAPLAERMALELNRITEQPSHAGLTNREFEVLRLILAGRRLIDIAEALHLSVKTVSTHKRRILDKMGLDSTAALIKYGLRHQLIDDAEEQG